MSLTDDQIRFREQHDMLSTLIQYPPFSSDMKKRSALVNALIDPEVDEPASAEETVRQAIVRQEEAMKTFEIELEEASLWMARYPLDADEATELALRLDGVSEDDISVHLSAR